jgi:MFS family permease
MRVSKPYYLTVAIIGPLVGMGLIAWATIRSLHHGEAKGDSTLFFIVGVACVVLASINQLILLYKAWRAIRDGHPRMTPGKAVGFLFIPFYNLYWVFQAYVGFAADYNAYIADRNITARPISKPLLAAFCVCYIIGIICSRTALAVVGIAAGVLAVFVVMELCNAINRVADHLDAQYGFE